MAEQEPDEDVGCGVPADPDMLVPIGGDDVVPIQRDQVCRVGRYVTCCPETRRGFQRKDHHREEVKARELSSPSKSLASGFKDGSPASATGSGLTTGTLGTLADSNESSTKG